MFRDITIGQYYKTDSILHNLDPRVKIFATLVYVISIFTFHHFAGFVVAGLFFFAMVWLSKVPMKFLVRGLKPIVMLLVFTGILHLFFTSGDVVVQMGVLHITKQGIYKCVFVTLRLLLMMLGASLLTLTTTPNRLTDGLEKMLRPLNRLHVPVHELAMMMSIALRFIPILVEELDKIMKAQLARGADFEEGNIIKRLKNMMPILVPLFASAMRRANELAYAMDARCYHGGQGRTKMFPLHYESKDIAAYLIIVISVLLLQVVCRIFAFSDYGARIAESGLRRQKV